MAEEVLEGWRKDFQRFTELSLAYGRDISDEALEREDLQRVLAGPKTQESDREIERLVDCKVRRLALEVEIAIYEEEFPSKDLWFLEEESYSYDSPDPFEDAASFALLLARRRRPEAAVRFSLKFQKAITGGIFERLKTSETISYRGVTWIWERILEGCGVRTKGGALSAILDLLEAGTVPCAHREVELLARHILPKLADRVLAILDKGVDEEKSEGWYPRQTHVPHMVIFRIAAMEAVGRADEVDGYLDANFPDCAFTLRNRMLKLKKQKDFRGAAEICKKLSTFEPLCKADRKAFEKQLPRLLKAAGLDPDVYAATEGGPGSVVPGLEKMQESATDAEWHEALSRAVERVLANPDKEPRLLAFTVILAQEEDPALLLDFLRKADRKKLWLAYFHFLKAHHPEELAEALLRHYAENPDDPGWPHQLTPKRTVYESWAKDILLVAKIKGQRKRALEFARELVEQHPTLRMLKTVFQERGLY